MKRIFAIFALAAFYVSMASLSFEKSDASESLTLEPNLPVQPYSYALHYPEHAIYGGYATIDTTIANDMITTHGATLGRVLFYDKQLSVNNTISCGSCHIQEFAFADTARFSKGLDDILTPRNSPTIADLTWSSGSPFFEGSILFWDCRSKSLEDAVLQPLQHPEELGKDLTFVSQKLSAINYYPSLFENAFGDSEVNSDRIASALTQFIRSMSSFDSHYDLVKMGEETFTGEEEFGEELFVTHCTKGCHNIHSLSTPFPRNNGLDLVSEDLGLGGWDGRPEHIGKFKCQTLRNVELTPPYMHDGRFNTLEEVVDFYSDDVQLHPNSDFILLENENFTGFNFNDDEKKALVTFLKTLNTQALLTHDKWSDPFIEVSSNNNLALGELINIFPNPVDEKLRIELKEFSNQTTNLTLFDLNGKLVWQNQVTDPVAEFEMSDFSTGIYILKIEMNGNLYSKKLFFK